MQSAVGASRSGWILCVAAVLIHGCSKPGTISDLGTSVWVSNGEDCSIGKLALLSPQGIYRTDSSDKPLAEIMRADSSIYDPKSGELRIIRNLPNSHEGEMLFQVSDTTLTLLQAWVDGTPLPDGPRKSASMKALDMKRCS